MIDLTAEMRELIDHAFEQGHYMLVATAGADGMPDVAFKGSLMAWDGEHLAFWERAHGTTLRNLEENPKMAALYRNGERRLMWRFFGEAVLHREGPVRDGVMARTVAAELDRDPERKGVAVVMRIDQVVERNQVIMARD